MGNLASSILLRHHTIDARRDFAQRLMTTLDEMRRNGGLECDVTLKDGSEKSPVHSIVISYSDELYKMCEQIKKEAAKEEVEAVADDKTEDVKKKKDEEEVEEKDDKEQVEESLQQEDEAPKEENESVNDPETSEETEEKKENE